MNKFLYFSDMEKRICIRIDSDIQKVRTVFTPMEACSEPEPFSQTAIIDWWKEGDDYDVICSTSESSSDGITVVIGHGSSVELKDRLEAYLRRIPREFSHSVVIDGSLGDKVSVVVKESLVYDKKADARTHSAYKVRHIVATVYNIVSACRSSSGAA